MTLTLGRRALSVARPREPLDTLCDGCSSDCKPTSQYVYLISDLVSTAETRPWILRASRSGDGAGRWLSRPKRLGPTATPDPEGRRCPGGGPRCWNTQPSGPQAGSVPRARGAEVGDAIVWSCFCPAVDTRAKKSALVGDDPPAGARCATSNAIFRAPHREGSPP